MDAAAIVRRFGGDGALVRQLVALFIAECPRMLNDVRRSVAAGRADDVRSTAHAFKGAVGNFTDAGPFVAALALEQAGRDGDVAAAPAALARLERETEQLLQMMRQFHEEVPCRS